MKAAIAGRLALSAASKLAGGKVVREKKRKKVMKDTLQSMGGRNNGNSNKRKAFMDKMRGLARGHSGRGKGKANANNANANGNGNGKWQWQSEGQRRKDLEASVHAQRENVRTERTHTPHHTTPHPTANGMEGSRMEGKGKGSVCVHVN